MYLEHENVYSEQQKRVLWNGINNDIEVNELKNPGIPTNLLECLIVAKSKSYDLEQLENAGIGTLSIVYLDCLRSLMQRDIDILQLVSDNLFVKYSDRQILTICDGLEYGFDIRLYGNICYSSAEMREIIENLLIHKSDIEYAKRINTYNPTFIDILKSKLKLSLNSFL